MKHSQWLAALGCWCLWAIPAPAEPTIQDFSNPGVKGTNYVDYGNNPGSAFVYTGGPPGAATYYRLTQAFVVTTRNMIAFDLTAAGPQSHIVVDFDYRIGGVDNPGDPLSTEHADGIGFALLPTSVYGSTGEGPEITEEASSVRDGSIGCGLDTWDNGPSYDPDNNHVSLTYITPNPRDPKPGPGIALNYAISLTALNYFLHQDPPGGFDDATTPFDHFNMTVDIGASGAVVSVTITPAGWPAISPISGFVIPGVTPFEMRAAFGGRTGSRTDNHDITNVSIQFSP